MDVSVKVVDGRVVLPVVVQRCLLGCALHLRRFPSVVHDPDRLARELCPDCAAAMRAEARR